MTDLTDFFEEPRMLAYPPKRLRDLSGRLKVSQHKNIYEADFEYGAQPLRWESYTVGGGQIAPKSATGGVQMTLSTAAGDVTIRQSRPYHRYQPGKTMAMASAINFGTANAGQRQRVGFFDDANGIFLEQADPTATNPYGMFAVIRSDVGGVPVDTRISIESWTGAAFAQTINWSAIQMVYLEYAWYGAGGLRWGIVVAGEPRILHEFAQGNSGAAWPWARTGNLPVRYEQRNLTAQSTGNTMYHWGVSVLVDGQVDDQRGFTYGYGMAAGTPARAPGASQTRYPLLSFRYRAMGTLEYGVDSAYSGANGNLPASGSAISAVSSSTSATTVTLTGTPLVAGAWVGKYFFARAATASITGITISGNVATATTAANPNYLTVGRWVIISGATPATGVINGMVQITSVSASTFTFATTATGTVTGTITYQTGQGSIGRITANTTSALTVVDNVQGGPLPVSPAVAGNYILGVINRGQLLPRTLSIFSSANCTLELIASAWSNPISLTGSSFATMYSLGSLNSFAERDVSATALSGGEVVYNTPLPAGALQTFDLSNFFALFNNVQGNQPDILTVAVTTPSTFGTGTVGASVICQEAMS